MPTLALKPYYAALEEFARLINRPVLECTMDQCRVKPNIPSGIVNGPNRGNATQCLVPLACPGQMAPAIFPSLSQVTLHIRNLYQPLHPLRLENPPHPLTRILPPFQPFP